MYYIYKIENLVNSKKYIGLSNNYQRRRARHFTDLRCNRHDNQFMQKEANIYGLENFSFEIIFEGNITYDEISQKEQEYIELYDSYYNGYNQNKGGNFGPSNGGSKLIKSDILNILSATEFMSRPGTILGKIYGVSNTTIMRIKRGDNHCEIYSEYWSYPLDKRKEIFQIFSNSYELEEKLAKSHALKSIRCLSEKSVMEVLANNEFHIMPTVKMAERLGVKSAYTLILIIQRKTYRDISIAYENLSLEEKKKICVAIEQSIVETS